MSKDASVYRIKPFEYIHVIDNNSGVTSVVVGPSTFTRQDHQKVVQEPQPMVILPPRHYCIISNPVIRSDDGVPETDENGNYKLKHGDEEIRFAEGLFVDPFPLYPGERLYGKVNPLQVVAPDSALRLRAMRDFADGKGSGSTKRVAGDEWLFIGPGTYIPKIEVQVVEIIRAHLIKPNEALLLRARRECADAGGAVRKAGEEWLMRTSGAYLPLVDEEVVEKREAKILTEQTALHFRAKRTYKDVFGHQRKAGEEWLVTARECEAYIQDVHEVFVTEVSITTLNNRQYCIVLEPVGSDGKPQFGKKELRRGPAQFFLQPGERLEKSIQAVNVLSEHESLLLTAKEECDDDDGAHKPGERWMVVGPREYVPPLAVEVVEKRFKIPLDANEGIYVRDINTGKIRAEIGASYMLRPNEELWEKELPETVETLLAQANASAGEPRDRTRVVTLRVPHNAAVQIYDYKEKRSRVQFGPNLVMLGPDEQFTVLSLSGGKPKRPHVIKALCLLLGPDFMTDIVTVETSDHARLSLQLAYNWMFEFDRESADDVAKLFGVPDFVGDVTKAIASRVRGAVAASSFDNFHRQSAQIIHQAVFGSSGKVNFKFAANNLVITNVDIQSVEPVDQRTRDSLQKSVQLAIEITTKSQEAAARHEAERKNQAATGRLEIQKINDEAKAEEERVELLKLQAKTISVEATGQATADSVAKADAALIVGKSEVDQAKLRTDAARIKNASELAQLKSRHKAEIDHRTQVNELELAKAEELAQIEAAKFKQIVDAIGADTIQAIAQAGPEMQAKLLQGLGLKGFMITDGNSPINLFGAAQGFIGAGPQAAAAASSQF